MGWKHAGWTLACAAMLLPRAHGASFDCRAAHSFAEKTVCSDAKLGALDSQVNLAYTALLRQLSPEAQGELRGDERAWLAFRDKVCTGLPKDGQPPVDCLNEVYAEQLAMLQSARRVGASIIFPRLVVETAPDTTHEQVSPVDPGFGTGRFAWPEADAATPPLAAWSKAVRLQVIQLSPTSDDHRHPGQTNFDPAGVADEQSIVSYVLHALNEHFAVVELDQDAYDYGGAHGGDARLGFVWWLDAQRPLQQFDIFGAGSAWKQPFADLCWKKLSTGPNGPDLFQSGDAMARSMSSRKDADKASLTLENWLVDATGITVLYQEYSVAPYAVGILSVHLGWNELQPYLASDFHPAALPQPFLRPKAAE